MRRVFLAFLVFSLVSLWLPAQSDPKRQESTQIAEVDPQQLVSRLNLRLKITGNGDVVIPANDLDLVFAELELVSNESLQNYQANETLKAENKKLADKIVRYQKLTRAAPWICLASFGAGVIAGCIGGYFVQK